MKRITITLFLVLSTLAACTTTSNTPPTLGPDGKPLPRVYRIAPADADDIQFRMLDSVNALRTAAAAPNVRQNAQLNAAAATHSRDMALQNRPWHFGSDGSSPIDRLARVGYSGRLVGETISETYETELQTLSAWMESPETRRVILDPNATDFGFSWFQEDNGKIWWTMVLGTQSLAPTLPQATEIANLGN